MSVFGLVIVAFVVTALMGVRQVPQNFNYTVERFGKERKTLTPGLGLISSSSAAASTTARLARRSGSRQSRTALFSG